MQCVDWPQVLADLQYLLGESDFAFPQVRTPLGTRALAAKLQVDRGQVRNWLDGTEPSYSRGKQLIELWVHVSGKGEQFVPMTQATYSAATARRA